MSKYKAQQILNDKDPELLKQIEAEVAEKAKDLKKKIMVIGFIVAAIIVGAIIYNEMNKSDSDEVPASPSNEQVYQ